MRTIVVVNRSPLLADDAVAAFVRGGLQTQVSRDFAPLWNEDAKLDFAKKSPKNAEQIVLVDTSDVAGALGYHEETAAGLPVGFVFVKTAQDAGEAWTATLSHEVLEQLVDPWCTYAVEGLWARRPALIALEVADPTENGEYQIAGAALSNFVTPEWFNAHPRGPTDFLGALRGKSFTLDKGGYLSYARSLGAWREAFAAKTPRHQRRAVPLSRRQRRLRPKNP